MVKSRMFPIRVGVILFPIAATNSIGFNQGHPSFLSSSNKQYWHPSFLISQLRRHNKAPSTPRQDANILLLRGGEIENSNDIETNGQATNVDDNKADALSSDSAWDEEIKRLQMYMNSPHSRRSRHNPPRGENSDAYGSGEDILVLGSRAFKIGNDDEHVSKSIVHEQSLNNATLVREDSTSVHESSCEDDLLHNRNTAADTSNEINDLSRGMRELSDDMNEDDEDQVKVAEINEELLEHVPSSEVNATSDDQILKNEDSLNKLDDEVLSVPSGDDDAIADVVGDMQQPQTPQMITDNYPNSLAMANEDSADPPIAVSHWTNTATSITDESNLVEIGLRKLRHKDGDHPSVPYVITRAMKRMLVEELGYDKDEVKAMRPDVAVVIVSEKLKRPNITALPSRFYHQDIEPMLQVASFRDTIQNKIQAFIRKINMKQIIVMLGSAIASYALLDIFRSSSSILVVNATDAKIQR